MTLGSLFDGISGFPLSASRLGIMPIWSAEIVSACISIAKRHFPDMKHLGDIKKLNGGEIKPVDIVTFGSPCQDLSLAGNREGLKGINSGLFLEAVRVIKEMRKAHGKPTFIVWENVVGTFSSKEGEDFRTVIEEIAKIAEAVSIPKPYKNKWHNAGFVMGNSFSIAWRVLDAQYWGVPQRRNRIFLLADFRGQRAGEILFKCEGLPGNFESGKKKRQGIAADTGNCVNAAGFNGCCSISGAFEQYAVDFGKPSDRIQINPNKAVTLKSAGGGGGAKTGLYCLPFTFQSYGQYKQDDISKSYMACDDITTGDLIIDNYGVRRLTPLEVERCFGFPDNYTAYGHDGKRISDSARYKALGNSVAIPCVERVLAGIKAVCKTNQIAKKEITENDSKTNLRHC